MFYSVFSLTSRKWSWLTPTGSFSLQHKNDLFDRTHWENLRRKDCRFTKAHQFKWFYVSTSYSMCPTKTWKKTHGCSGITHEPPRLKTDMKWKLPEHQHHCPQFEASFTSWIERASTKGEASASISTGICSSPHGRAKCHPEKSFLVRWDCYELQSTYPNTDSKAELNKQNTDLCLQKQKNPKPPKQSPQIQMRKHAGNIQETEEEKQ